MEQPPPKESRVPVNLRIKFRSETIEQFVERYAIDVSRGGIFIRTREPLAVGTQLKFDFQLQDTSPLMAGEGTVVWIREHDPSRAGVTPGMGVRFDKLTPASQPVLEKILTDKSRLQPSGPVSTSTTSVSLTSSGKSGANPLPVRRPSSTFSAVEPGAAGSAGASPVTPPPAGVRPAITTPPVVTPPLAGAGTGTGAPSKTSQPTPMGLKSPIVGAGAMPTLETQSALGRLATGPNLGTFGAVAAPRTKSPVPPLAHPAVESGAESAGAAAVPTAIEDSEKTQIADGLPDFSNEPTHVGGPALGLAEVIAGRTSTSTSTAKRTPTPAPDARPSLDQGMAANGAAPLAAPGMPPARTTAADASASASTLESRLSGNQPVVAATPVEGASPDQPPAANAPRKRPTAFIIVGVLAGTVAAVVIANRMSAPDHAGAPPAPTAASTAPANPSPPATAAPAPAAPANPTAVNPEAPKTETPAPNAPSGAPSATAGTGTAREATPGEAKPGEAKPGEAKPGDSTSAEAKVAEAKPPEAKPVVAEPAPVVAKAPGGRRQRMLARKKGALPKNEPAAAELGGEAVEAASAADAAVGTVARITSTPSGAEVLIDGQSVGKTPFQGKDIDSSVPHALTVHKDGFENHEHMISPSEWIKGKGAGQSLKLTVKLTKARGGADKESAGEKKPDKPTEPAAAESPKTDPAPTPSAP